MAGGGVSFSEEWLLEYREKERHRKALASGSPSTLTQVEADPGPESDLQTKIENWCEEHALPYFHDRSRGKNDPGFVDLVIAFPKGVTLWAENKSKGGRLSDDQKTWQRALLFLGHKWVEIRSFKQFLSIAVPLL